MKFLLENNKVSNTMRPNHELIKLGKFYGYPVCCIVAFLKDTNPKWEDDRRAPFHINGPTKKHPWNGSGFIPCSGCVPFARADFKKFVEYNITPNRECKEPFPNGNLTESEINSVLV